MKILNFGSLNYDYVYRVDHILRPKETLASEELKVFCGGKGLNQSVALARAGAEVYHAGMVGEDGDLLIDLCKENGIHTGYIRKTAGKSGHTVIQVDREGQNGILLFGGSNQKISGDYIQEVLENFNRGDVLVLQNEINRINTLIEEGYKKGMMIVLNPSPINDGIKNCDLGKVDYFLMNEVEGEELTGKKEPEEMLKVMGKIYKDAKVVLTLGEKGAYYQDGENRFYEEAVKTEAVDTTAAGDTFTGFFLASVLKENDPKKALASAAKAASLAVSRAGAVASIPYLKELF
jgi:ribokinase